eukprot:TRINITY_DN53937_c0_g1_i1.p1 TRINITY_DN53937_c0_g1~~TRINITY_DN53937_c0_g1_i1.p1  ORF type:complete len:339 (-),score=64.37 TRINITY_DN53937_c0_g1_i1:265-1281(-)
MGGDPPPRQATGYDPIQRSMQWKRRVDAEEAVVVAGTDAAAKVPMGGMRLDVIQQTLQDHGLGQRLRDLGQPGVGLGESLPGGHLGASRPPPASQQGLLSGLGQNEQRPRSRGRSGKQDASARSMVAAPSPRGGQRTGRNSDWGSEALSAGRDLIMGTPRSQTGTPLSLGAGSFGAGRAAASGAGSVVGSSRGTTPRLAVDRLGTATSRTASSMHSGMSGIGSLGGMEKHGRPPKPPVCFDDTHSVISGVSGMSRISGSVRSGSSTSSAYYRERLEEEMQRSRHLEGQVEDLKSRLSDSGAGSSTTMSMCSLDRSEKGFDELSSLQSFVRQATADRRW